jgi:hypothetical protein
LPAGLAAALLIVAAVGAVALTGSAKLPPDPWAGLSNPEREAQVQAAYDQQAKFIRDFQASGRDPRSLRRDAAEAFFVGPDSLREALRSADVVVVATVRNTTFEPVAGQWLGQARVTIDVLRGVKGEPEGALELIQPGSPAPTADGHGQLQEVDIAPVLLPGDRVLLMLHMDASGTLTPLPGAGIVYLEAGRARALDRSPLRSLVSGRTEAEVLDLYTAALSDTE